MARIVLIDDEERLLRTLQRFLEQQGHEVRVGESFRAVESHLFPGLFDVLVTDIVMPEFDGISILREVVEVRDCQEPVILITGEPNVETASEAVRRGAFDYISKPVTKDKIIDAVSRGLRHVQLLRERDSARRSEIEILRNLARLGESASVLSHEIRTPVTSLRHALRAVGDKLGVDDKVLVEELLVNLQKIERILGKSLSLVRPLAVEARPMPLAKLVRESARAVTALDGMDGLSIEVGIEDDLEVEVDPTLFGEVLVNLLRNAAEACGGTGHIEIAASAHPSGWFLEITDDGPGVPGHLREEIFQPFRSFKEHGTGIGLALSRKVVESHGGEISLIDKPGFGACFRITMSDDSDAPARA
ncbi:MAG: response regulator [bacterium]|nr:response regulator [bacterium]